MSSDTVEINAHPEEQSIAACDVNLTWIRLKDNAAAVADQEPTLKAVLKASILSHCDLGSSISEIIAFELSSQISSQITRGSWLEILETLFNESGIYDPVYGSVLVSTARDLEAIKERDPAAFDYVNCFLFLKGFKAIQMHRAAHMLWGAGRMHLALMIQSRCSELYGIDIHPGALIGPGLVLDHGTGVVIGETARVGANCIILHGVTLGGIGKHIVDIVDCNCPNIGSMVGRRHPTIGSEVLIGCNASLLGPICVGDGAKIGSSSVVLKTVPARCTAVGSPARVIGRSHVHTETTAVEDVYTSVGTEPKPQEDLYSVVYLRTWTLWADCVNIFSVLDTDSNAMLTLSEAITLWALKVKVAEGDIPVHFLKSTFREMNANPTTGTVYAKELQVAIIAHIKEIEDTYHYSYQI